MFLQPVTKFFIGSFLEGMDGPLGYRQFGSDFSILFPDFVTQKMFIL